MNATWGRMERIVTLAVRAKSCHLYSEFKRIKDIKMFIRQFWRSGNPGNGVYLRGHSSALADG